jgi:hypothetical protein
VKILAESDTHAWGHKFTCQQCSTVLEAGLEDIRYMEGDRPGEDGSFYAVCPKCGHRYWFPSTVVIPIFVKQAARAKPTMG